MKITDALLAEHVVFHALFDHIERSATRLKTLGEVRTLADLLESMLVQHSKAEDELLMKYLDDSIEQMGHHETFDVVEQGVKHHVFRQRAQDRAQAARGRRGRCPQTLRQGRTPGLSARRKGDQLPQHHEAGSAVGGQKVLIGHGRAKRAGGFAGVCDSPRPSSVAAPASFDSRVLISRS
jgi:hypothetical protein